MPAAKNPDVFFVGLKETKDVRRSIIESTKDVIVFLQKYEKFLTIRKEKNQAIAQLKGLVKEINNMTSSLKNKLPESQIHRKLTPKEIEIEKEILDIALEMKDKDIALSNKLAKMRRSVAVPAKSKGKKTKTKQDIKQEKEQSEMERLESQLKDLENKLRHVE